MKDAAGGAVEAALPGRRRARGELTPARGEWFSVGDVAYMDEEGFVYICDRKRDTIIRAA